MSMVVIKQANSKRPDFNLHFMSWNPGQSCTEDDKPTSPVLFLLNWPLKHQEGARRKRKKSLKKEKKQRKVEKERGMSRDRMTEDRKGRATPATTSAKYVYVISFFLIVNS